MVMLHWLFSLLAVQSHFLGGIIKGHVSRVDPTSVNGTVTVEVLFDQPTPPNARADLSVDGVIEIEDAALYKSLHRLERAGSIEAEWGLSENNRKAKF